MQQHADTKKYRESYSGTQRGLIAVRSSVIGNVRPRNAYVSINSVRHFFKLQVVGDMKLQ